MITEKTIKEFQIVLQEEYGQNVPFEVASLILKDLTGYFDVLSKVYHRMQTEKEGDTIVKPD